MVADRILISSNTISHILNNFFIWAYRKILFDVSNIGGSLLISVIIFIASMMQTMSPL